MTGTYSMELHNDTNDLIDHETRAVASGSAAA
jgi:hypothetical protein